MAEDNDEGFSFGDFKSAPSQLLHPINGGLTSTSQNDDAWGDFFFTAPSQLNGGFSPSHQPPSPQPPPKNHSIVPKSSINFDAFGSPGADLSPIRADPGSSRFQKPNGALPLSLFGEVEGDEAEKGSIGNDIISNLNGGFESNSPSQNGKIEVQSVSNVNGWFDPNPNPPGQNGKIEVQSVSNTNGWFDPSPPHRNGKIEVQSVSNVNGWFDPNPPAQNHKIEVQSVSNSNGWFDPNPSAQNGKIEVQSVSNLNSLFDSNPPAQNGKIEVHSVSNGIGFNNDGDIFGKLFAQNQQITKPEKGSGLIFDGSASDLNNLDEEEDDEWEFMDASSANGVAEGNFENHDNSVSSQSKVKPVAVTVQEKQAGQDPSYSADHHHGLSSSFPQPVDLFAAHHGVIHKSDEKDIGFNFNLNTTVSNGFMSDLFPRVEEIGTGSGISATSVHEDDDFDDFGDFVDASQEVGPRKQEQVVPQTTPAEAQLPNGTIQHKKAQPEGALPLSLFSNCTEESSDVLNHQDEMINKPNSTPRNGFSSQGTGISIHDLLSNLYSQAQQTSSTDSNKKPAENGVYSPPKNVDSTLLSDDDWDDNSWEFKYAPSETGVKEVSSSHTPGIVPQTASGTLSNLQFYMDFFATMRDALCFLLSHQLDEEKESQSSGTVIGNDGKAAALSDEIQEAYKLLEDSKISQEVLSKKQMERSTCLNEVLEALQELKLKVIESEYSLSKRLQLAANDWRITTELLRHAISFLHILSLGSADDQSVYVSTWSKIVNVCAEELKYGALIWKRVLEKNVQRQILSDRRGQQYIVALGEIYKVVEVLGLSAKLYKPWMLLSFSNPPQFVGPLDECRTYWLSSGLDEALQIILDSVDYGCNQPAKALIASIKNIHDVNVFALHDRVFVQRKSLCRLSLLPPEMLADLKMVSWNGEPYFLNLANLWANLISCSPPQLPHLQVN